MNNKETFISLLKSTNRQGVDCCILANNRIDEMK